MTDDADTNDADTNDAPPSRRLAALLGLPEPKPLSEDEERAYQQWLADGDAQVAEILARRRRGRVTQARPHILDASALVELFSGHQTLMRLLDDADAGDRFVIVPTLAIAEAQAVLNARQSHWDRILGVRSLLTIDLSPHVAVEVGRLAGPRLRHHPVHTPLIGPLMAAQVLHEAQMLNGVIVTRIPEAYGGHDVAVQTI